MGTVVTVVTVDSEVSRRKFTNMRRFSFIRDLGPTCEEEDTIAYDLKKVKDEEIGEEYCEQGPDDVSCLAKGLKHIILSCPQQEKENKTKKTIKMSRSLQVGGNTIQ